MPAKNKKASVTVAAGKRAQQAASLLPDLEPACPPASQTAASPASSPALGAETIAHLPPDRHLPALKQALLDWFAVHQRDLPWRASYTPYEVWISEVMLQQTQMERGVSYFLRWMQRFPDIATLAAAHEEDVLD